MPRSISLSLAIASLVVLTSPVGAVRPHYGGTMTIETEATIRTLDPAGPSADGLQGHLVPLIYETLVGIDPEGGLRPVLATEWTSSPDARRWRLRVRRAVRWHDGSVVQAAQVAAALGTRLSETTIGVEGEFIVIDSPQPRVDLPWELADARNAIVLRTLDGMNLGTGPFAIDRLESGRVVLRAHGAHWSGRPFLDRIQIEMGRLLPAQLSDLELGRADLVTVQPSDARRLSQRQLRLVASRPLQLYALMFEAHRAGAAQAPLRRTLSAAIDRSAIGRVVFQGLAEPAEALLPPWLSGYSPRPELRDGSRLSAAAIGALPQDQRSLTVRVDSGDPLARLMADRIAVNARDAGLTLSVQAPAGTIAPRFDLRVVRAPIPATTPDRALAQLVATLGPRAATLTAREVPPALGSRLPDVYSVESALIENAAIIPVVHVPELYGIDRDVHSTTGSIVTNTGQWDLANVWLSSAAQRTR